MNKRGSGGEMIIELSNQDLSLKQCNSTATLILLSGILSWGSLIENDTHLSTQFTNRDHDFKTPRSYDSVAGSISYRGLRGIAQGCYPGHCIHCRIPSPQLALILCRANRSEGMLGIRFDWL